MRCSGAMRPSPRCMLGATASLSTWWKRQSQPRTPQGKPWPVMDFRCRSRAKCRGVLCEDVPSVGSPAPFSRGWLHTLTPRGNGPSCSSGIILPGTSTRRCRVAHRPQSPRQTGGGGRVTVCRLPSKRPCLNPIKPKWVHGKRAVMEPAQALSTTALMQRGCAYYHCELRDTIAHPDY
jgi:hypothetical protein